MTPEARVAAAIDILDAILEGKPAEAALTGWARKSRFAGSGDRYAVRDLVYDSLRRRRSRAALGGGLTGRGLMLGACREQGIDPDSVFTDQGFAPRSLTTTERLVPELNANDQLNLPDWLIPKFEDAFGSEKAQDIAHLMQERAPVWLRVNIRKADPANAIQALANDGITTQSCRDLPTALQITANERRLSGSAAYQNGLVELQDLSPQLACEAIHVTDGEDILDYCAGGGGKSLAMAAQGARVTAHDAIASRMTDLSRRAERAGVRIPTMATAKLAPSYDRVVVDVPCSGSGTWRRDPEGRWRLTPERLAELVTLQQDILNRAAAYVRVGGELDYMTCSVLREENDTQISKFLARNPDFAVVSLQSWSPLSASDGFFCARLQRVNG